MKRNGIATLILASAVFWVTNASAIGVGVGVILPTGDFKDSHDTGVSAHLVMDYPVTPLASIYGDLGWQGFQAKGVEGIDFEGADISMWSISAGAKAGFGAVYVGGEVGYYIISDGIDNEIGATPVLGTKMGPLDLSARYKFLDDIKWFEVRAGIGF
ncbi:MAG: hypothetical protein GY838_19110 [bacterium]|nr:hypothetical protein [bacterium]